MGLLKIIKMLFSLNVWLNVLCLLEQIYGSFAVLQANLNMTSTYRSVIKRLVVNNEVLSYIKVNLPNAIMVLKFATFLFSIKMPRVVTYTAVEQLFTKRKLKRKL